jgi:hypothetical protein
MVVIIQHSYEINASSVSLEMSAFQITCVVDTVAETLYPELKLRATNRESIRDLNFNDVRNVRTIDSVHLICWQMQIPPRMISTLDLEFHESIFRLQ